MHVRRIRRLRENTDAHVLLRQCHRVDVIGHLADDIRLPADAVEPFHNGLNARAPARNDQRIIRQVIQRHIIPLFLCKRVVLGNQRNPRLLPDYDAAEVLIIEGICNDRQIRESSCQVLENVIGAPVPHLVFHHGILLAKARNKPRRDIGSPPLYHTEGYGAGQTALHMRKVRPCLIRQ